MFSFWCFWVTKKWIPKIDSQNWFPPKKYSKPPFFQRSSLWKPAGLLQNIRIYGLRRLASQFEVHVSLSPHVAPAASACCWRHWRRNHPANFDRRKLTQRKWKTPITGQIFQKTNRDVHGMKSFKKAWLIRIMFMGALQKLSSLFFDFSDHTE